ncbi:MAG: FHA domain-containing protein [Bacteroidetes Order II. Incertae sedis bacterium]|nr:FHA domain-containing protein [Bacteroidetes Order II. bacterium]
MLLKYTLNGLLQEVQIQKEVVTLGRSAQCEIQLDDPGCLLSRKHARIYLENELWHIMDLGSHNGTWLDGKRLTPHLPYPLNPQSAIVLGRILIEPIFLQKTSPVLSKPMLMTPSGDSLGTYQAINTASEAPLHQTVAHWIQEQDPASPATLHGKQLRDLLNAINEYAATLDEDAHLAYLIEVFTDGTQDIRGGEIGRFLRAVLRR